MPGARASLARLGVHLEHGPDAQEFVGHPLPVPRPRRRGRLPRRARARGAAHGAVLRARRPRRRARGRPRARAGRHPGRPTADGVLVGGLRARWCVAADGLHSPTRRALGLDRALPGTTGPGARDLRAAARALRAAPALPDRPVEPARRRAVVPGRGGLRDAGRPRRRGRRRPHRRRGRPRRPPGPLPRPRRTAWPGSRTPPAPAGRARCGRSRAGAAPGRVLLVGDAAGYVDALTGEGIAVGLACAREAVACVLADDASDYEQRWRRASRELPAADRRAARGLVGAAAAPGGRPGRRAAAAGVRGGRGPAGVSAVPADAPSTWPRCSGSRRPGCSRRSTAAGSASAVARPASRRSWRSPGTPTWPSATTWPTPPSPPWTRTASAAPTTPAWSPPWPRAAGSTPSTSCSRPPAAARARPRSGWSSGPTCSQHPRAEAARAHPGRRPRGRAARVPTRRWSPSPGASPGCSSSGAEATAGTDGARLVADVLASCPAGSTVLAAVAPGNARSLRSFLRAGMRPVGSVQVYRPARG